MNEKSKERLTAVQEHIGTLILNIEAVRRLADTSVLEAHVLSGASRVLTDVQARIGEAMTCEVAKPEGA